MNAFGLKNDLIISFCEVFSNYPEIEKVLIYGSRAKGDFREGSDIDLTLVGSNVTETIRSKVWLDLDNLDSPYLIDLSVLNNISSESLQDHINRVGKILYKKNHTNIPVN